LHSDQDCGMQVDFVLLGGDLFHDNKPSRTTIVRAMEILGKYCLKPKPITFKLLSDEAKAFVSGYTCSPTRVWPSSLFRVFPNSMSLRGHLPDS